MLATAAAGSGQQDADTARSASVAQVLNMEVKAKVLNDAKLRSWSSINLLGIRLNLPIMTEKDRHDLTLAIDAEVDIVAASFVRTKDDLEYVKDMLIDEGGADIKVVAKIETIEALENLDEILEEADGVMVARGDLGTHITPEKVFLAQNMITTKVRLPPHPPPVCPPQLPQPRYQTTNAWERADAAVGLVIRRRPSRASSPSWRVTACSRWSAIRAQRVQR